MAIKWKTRVKLDECDPDQQQVGDFDHSLKVKKDTYPTTEIPIVLSDTEDRRDTEKNQKLTDGQFQVKQEAVEWFNSFSSRSRLLSGYAGVGKTYMLVDLVNSLVESGHLTFEQVIGIAPTHTAVGVLKQSTGEAFSEYKTLASLLRLRPSLVEWTGVQELQLQELLNISEVDLTPDEAVYLESLSTLKKASEEMIVSFNPTQSMSSIAEDLKHVRLIIVDEASMIDKIQFSLLNELTECSECHPQLQVIFVGDPCQLPPIQEKSGRCMDIGGFAPLTEVVRYDGSILDYCTQIRNGAALESLHYQVEHDDSLILCPYVEGVRIAAQCIENDENVRIMAATNAAVDTINYQVRQLVKKDQRLFYEPGDVLITKSPIARDQYGNCRPYPSKRNQIKISLGTSALIRIEKITGSSTYKSQFGTTFEKLHLKAVDIATGLVAPEAVVAINPSQWDKWQEEQKQAFQMYMSTSTRSKKGSKSRGQEGKAAEQAWEFLGIKNWYKHKSGVEITNDEYKSLKRRLQAGSFQLRQCADEVTYSYASTVHRAQGAGYDIVLLHMDTLTRTPRGGGDSTWDTRKLLYTAATRARKQLVFLV